MSKLKYLELADIVSQMSTCIVEKVGAVIVVDDRIISTGYKGAPRGATHCTEGRCLMDRIKNVVDNSYERCRGVPAEVNAIININQETDFERAVLYMNSFPSFNGMKVIMNKGIKKVVIGRKESTGKEEAIVYGLRAVGIIVEVIEWQKFVDNEKNQN